MQKYTTIDFKTCDDLDEVRKILMKRIAHNIRLIRKRKGLTQEQVAERADISHKFLGELERGVKNPSASVLYRISKALGEPCCVLISRDCCPYRDDGLPQRLAKMMMGRPDKDVKKAVKVLEIILE